MDGIRPSSTCSAGLVDAVNPTTGGCLAELAERWSLPIAVLERYWGDLQHNGTFLRDLNDAIRDVPEFMGKQFTHVDELRVFRCLLYLLVRATRPRVVVETGVHNGMSSAFMLLAMADNGEGRLHSIDLPPDPRILAQGTNPLPEGKAPGWLIPSALRARHSLRLGPAEELLPRVLAEERPLSLFLHDSDHAYSHMMFEMGLAWRYLQPGAWMVVDNIEQNRAFGDFALGVAAPHFSVASFDSPERVWKHGLLMKPTTV